MSDTPPSPQNPPLSRSKALIWLTMAILILALLWFLYWEFYAKYYESTDDAYANGNFISINSVIPGAVTAFYADNTDLVKEGQLLVTLDTTRYEAIYQKELATLANVTLKVKQLYYNVEVSRANLENKRTEAQQSQINYQDRLTLQENNPQAVAKEDFTSSQHALLSAQFSIQQAESQLDAALAEIGNTPPEQHPLIIEQKNNVRTAFYNLEHCSIYAPSTGYIAQRSVNVGQWITPNTDLMAVIPITGMWVDANFKETQLEKMRVGQPAEVWFDLYGSSVKYKGKVLGIASGTGSVFSLIPAQNATGNWIKIVQRLPVRISLDPEVLEKFPARLGISAEVSVDLTNQDLPFLSPVPSTQSIAQTTVFDIHMQKMNAIMDDIIQKNLQKLDPKIAHE